MHNKNIIMIIKQPIYFIRAEGDIKKKAVKDSKSLFVSFEEYLNETWIIIDAYDFGSHDAVKMANKYIKMGANDVCITYSKEGINIEDRTVLNRITEL